MEKAQQAVKSFVSGGHNDTTVHESVAPHVQKETVNRHDREETHVARDREIHQDHHHTTIQPIHDQEVLPEQHHHNAVGVEHVTHDHRDPSSIKGKLDAEKAQFKDETVRAPVQHHKASDHSEVVGEHVHHHVHENIQPVVHKQTIEPHVVHTTVPIHETHHKEAQHHAPTTLPAVNMSDYKREGGKLTGLETRESKFGGEPHSLGKTIGNATPTTSVTEDRDTHYSGAVKPIEARHSDGVATDAAHHANGPRGSTRNTVDGPVTSDVHHTTSHGSAASTHSKPSLLDKINPKKDADGDGKKGFMS